MTRNELESLTVYRGDELEESGIPAGTAELWNCSGLVATFPDRDAAYAEIRRLRGARAPEPIDTTELRAALAAGADFAAGSEIIAARVLAAAARV